MTGRSVNYQSAIATQQTNQTGITSPVLTVSPDNGTMLSFLNQFPRGSGSGLPLIAKFRDSSNNPLPVDTELIARVVRPTDDSPVAVSIREDDISTYVELDTKEQRNEEFIDSVKIGLKGQRINVRDKDELRFELESSVQIDWSNSELYIPREAVVERPYEG